MVLMQSPTKTMPFYLPPNYKTLWLNREQEFPIEMYMGGSITWTLLHCSNIIKRDYYKTNKENGCILYGWRLSIDRLVHENINTKIGVLLQSIPCVSQVVCS